MADSSTTVINGQDNGQYSRQTMGRTVYIAMGQYRAR